MRRRSGCAPLLALVVIVAASVTGPGASAETIPAATELVEPAPPGVVQVEIEALGLRNTMSRAGDVILFLRPGSAFAHVELVPAGRASASPAMAAGERMETAAVLGDLPLEYALRRNVPNPSRGMGSIGFDLPTASRVRLEIYDLQGRRVHTVVNGELPAGRYDRTWNARDGGRERLAPGVYFASMDARATLNGTRFTKVAKLVLIE